MSATQVDAASLRKLFTASAKSLPEGLDADTLNKVRDHLISHLKADAKAAQKKAARAPRGPTGYFLFMQENREAVKKTMPDAKITEISAKIGENWRALSDKKRAEWNAKAKAMAPEPTAEQKAAAEAKAAKPKRPPTPYFKFMADKRESVKKANPDMNVKQIASKLGEMWRGMTDAQKAKYKSA